MNTDHYTQVTNNFMLSTDYEETYIDDIKHSKDTWHALSIDHYTPLLNLQIMKVSKVLEQQ